MFCTFNSFGMSTQAACYVLPVLLCRPVKVDGELCCCLWLGGKFQKAWTLIIILVELF